MNLRIMKRNHTDPEKGFPTKSTLKPHGLTSECRQGGS